MNRKIEWRSMELDEIELVYEKAENNHNIETLLEQLETQALEEAKNNMGMLKTDTGNVLKPEQFESLSDTDKETVIKVLGNAGLSALNTDLQTATIIITLSPIITRVQACTVFNILNRIEKLDGAITILKPEWKLKLQVPLGGRKGLFQWEMLIMQLYPWLSVQEESTNAVAISKEIDSSQETSKPSPHDPFVTKMNQFKAYTDESENNRPYEYSEGMPSKGFGLPKELAALLPNPDRIIITSFSSAGNTFGTRMRFGFGMNGMNDIYKAQNFIQYRCKRSKNSEQAQNCTSLFADSFHPFVQRYANDISGCVENILHSIMYTPISYELTDGILNAYLDSGYHETYYQETSEYIRFNDRYQESFHDGGGNGFEEWYVYAASITEYKTEISDVIGYKHFSAWPSASLPYCRGFWTEDGHVYLVDPWGLSGIFEFYHYSEGRPDAFSEEEIEIVGTPYKKQT